MLFLNDIFTFKSYECWGGLSCMNSLVGVDDSVHEVTLAEDGDGDFC